MEYNNFMLTEINYLHLYNLYITFLYIFHFIIIFNFLFFYFLLFGNHNPFIPLFFIFIYSYIFI